MSEQEPEQKPQAPLEEILKRKPLREFKVPPEEPPATQDSDASGEQAESQPSE